jgi:hypothetical protein
MAISLGFGQGNKNTPMSGSTGGGSIQPKLQLNGQGQMVTDGSGGVLNYLQGLMKSSPATAPANQQPLAPAATGGAPGQPGASTAAAGADGRSAAGNALAGQAANAVLGGGASAGALGGGL